MLYAEGFGDLAVVDGEADLLPGLAACYLVCAAGGVGMSAVAVEGGVIYHRSNIHGVSSKVSALPPGKAAWPASHDGSRSASLSLAEIDRGRK